MYLTTRLGFATGQDLQQWKFTRKLEYQWCSWHEYWRCPVHISPRTQYPDWEFLCFSL